MILVDFNAILPGFFSTRIRIMIQIRKARNNVDTKYILYNVYS